jgi:hypothetical protein
MSVASVLAQQVRTAPHIADPMTGQVERRESGIERASFWT